MPIKMSLHGAAPGFLIAPLGKRVFPAMLRLQSASETPERVRLVVSDSGAAIALERSEIDVDSRGAEIPVHATSLSNGRNDVCIQAFVGGALQGSIAMTCIEKLQLFFDGRFEVRFATNGDPYNHPRGTPNGWMWSLEGEPDFVPADSVPDRIEKPVGRAIRFHDAAAPRPHVPVIGVFVRSIRGRTATGVESFTAGDPAIDLPVNLGPDSYFGSNFPVSPDDTAAGRLPEEQHQDGFQPIALFEFHVGTWFSGRSKVGPFVPGTTLSSNPRSPDSRPRANDLVALTPGEIAAYPFPPIRDFSEARVAKLLPDFVARKSAGQTNTPEFRNLRTRVGHLLPDVNSILRAQLLADHADVGLVRLPANASFAYGQFREVYRGLIDDQISVVANQSPVLDYLAGFGSIHFLGVFFNFHTDEACAHTYGVIDPFQAPDTL